MQSLLLSTIPLAAILANTYLIPLRMTYPFQSFCLVLGTLFAYLFMADRQKSMEEERYNESLKEALELEKKASRQAVEAGKVKTIFLANMSHDIRTPINAILGFTDMIDRNPGDKAQVVNAVGKIKNSGQVLLNLINDVLDLTRIENGKLELEESDVDLTALVKDMETLFLPSAKQKGIALTIWQEVANPYVHCDEGKLQRILVNIINNAVKFTPAGGKIIFLQRRFRETMELRNMGSGFRIRGSVSAKNFRSISLKPLNRNAARQSAALQARDLAWRL